MATHQLSLNECNTPWWYETPSLVSQSTFSSNTYCTGTSQIDPFDITPSQSSGYYDEETTASEASSNMFTGGTDSCATCSEWSGTDSALTRASNKPSTRSACDHDQHRAVSEAARERGGSHCEHCGNHSTGGRVVHHDHSDGSTDGAFSDAHAKVMEHSERSEVMIAPASLTVDSSVPLPAFSSSDTSEVGPTPSTCTELNALGDSQDIITDEENHYNDDYYGGDSSKTNETDYRESQLSHSMASTNQQILRELSRDLMQNIDSLKLFPYLQRSSLLSIDDVDYISNPKRTENERRKRIIVSAPCRDPDAFDRFLDCLSVERNHSGHAYLAKRMREAIKRKRENPFKTMSSLRGKKSSSGRHHSESDAHAIKKQPSEAQNQQSSSVHSSPRYRHRQYDGELESRSRQSPSSKSHSPNVREDRQTGSSAYREQISPPQVPPRSSRMSNSTSTTSSSTATTQSTAFTPRHLSPSAYEESSVTSSHVGQHGYYNSRRSPSSSPGSSNYTYMQPPTNRPIMINDQDAGVTDSVYQRGFYDNYKQDYCDNYNQPGGYSSLPRHFSNSTINSILSRGSPAYSSARYEAEHKRKSKSLNRHGSFHSHNDSSTQLVSPLTRRTPPTDGMGSSHQQPYTYDHPRKYSLPVTSQQSVSFNSAGKSHSGSQLPSVRSSPYPPLREDVGGGRVPNGSVTHGDYVISDASSMDYSFPTFYSQWHNDEDQYTTTHRQPHLDPSTHYYQTVSPSMSESRSRHSSLQTGPALMREQSPHSISDLQDSIEDLSLPPGRQSVERTHRRSQSCDTSKAQREGLVPAPYEEVKTRHQSLIRRQRPAAYENVNRDMFTGKETGDARLIRRKILWLQERVHFTDFSEDLNFLSLTHYHQPRSIIYSGTLYEHGKPRFLVLLTDMLLILKPKKRIKMNMVQSKLGVQMPQLDWFSDLGCKTKRPLFLHLMMVQKKLRKYSSECFSIRYNNNSEMVEVTLQAVSKEAKEIWVESLSQAIKVCTEDHAHSILPVGNRSSKRRDSGQSCTKLSLTVLQANNLALSTSNCKTRNHYCSMELATQKCRTPSVKAKCWPSWNFQCDFCDFPLTETMHVGFYAERTTCPDDFLGSVEIDLGTLLQSQLRQVQEINENLSKLLVKNQAFSLMNGKGTITFDIELGWETNM